MPKIILSASGPDSAVFLINGKRYRYSGLSGLAVLHIRSLAYKRPGAALAIAKRDGELWG